jgi:hypothetical protein
MRILFFWDMKVHHGIIISRRFERMQCLYLQGSQSSDRNAEGRVRKDTDYQASQKNGIDQHSTVKACETVKKNISLHKLFKLLTYLNSFNNHNYHTQYL